MQTKVVFLVKCHVNLKKNISKIVNNIKNTCCITVLINYCNVNIHVKTVMYSLVYVQSGKEKVWLNVECG